MKLIGSLLLIFFLLLSCKVQRVQPSFVTFISTKDSIAVVTKNVFNSPAFVTTINNATNQSSYFQLRPLEEKKIMTFNKAEASKNSILKKVSFKQQYGYHETHLQHYDTLYNYQLPYLKQAKYKIIQGYNGTFTHNTFVSRYTLDFNTQIGDTIVASRGGVVLKTIMHHNKQGVSSRFRPYANYIVIYHRDNTIAQYVHLKQHSNLVKVGDTVKTNQPIALSGFTGLTTEPHLHFGVFKSNRKGIYSIPIILDAIPAKNYKKNNYYLND